jgi:hypothetical protein
VWVDLCGNIDAARIAMYSAWLGAKARKTGYVEISRETLVKLWRVSVPTLLRWEEALGVEVTARYAEEGDLENPNIPYYADLEVTTDGQTVAYWRLPNRYTPPPADLGRQGNIRRIRTTVNSLHPDSFGQSGKCNLVPVGSGRVYFYPTHKQPCAYRAVDKHLRKYGDVQRPHYAYMGRRGRALVYERTSGAGYRGLLHRDYRAEASPDFQQRRRWYRIGWQERL